jgi:hypothetical protein
MTDPFNALLSSLGTLFGLPLMADKQNACAFQIKKGLVIQLQPDEAMEKVLIVTRVAEVAPGKFREEVLKETLKANGLADPRAGTFAYMAKNNILILFQHYPIDILNGERLAGLIIPFIELADAWRTAVLSGKTGPGQTAPTFGIFR